MAEQIISASGTQYPLIINADGSLNTSAVTGSSSNLEWSLNYKQYMDYQGTQQPVYIGVATPGTGSETAGWLLRKYIYENQMPVAVLFGSGNSNFDKKWSLRSGTDEEYS